MVEVKRIIVSFKGKLVLDVEFNTRDKWTTHYPVPVIKKRKKVVKGKMAALRRKHDRWINR